ncbi:MAG: transporter substrate-binding domain-containing protein [Betaproteobacteria bacterium]
MRRRLLALALPLLALGCAWTPAQQASAPAEVRSALAPTGVLRVGVYAGSPTSLVSTRSGQAAGISHDLGTLMARELGVPVRMVEFSRVAQVLEAIKVGQVDVTFTNATEARAREVDFTPALVRLELGYLAPAGSAIRSLAQVDQPGVRVGVSQGSSSQAVLPGLLKQARLVPLGSLAEAARELQSGRIDLFATNKGILFELADQTGAQVLPGRWGLEHLALAVPQGRASAMPWLRDFAQRAQASGQIDAMAQRAGLRGLATD